MNKSFVVVSCYKSSYFCVFSGVVFWGQISPWFDLIFSALHLMISLNLFQHGSILQPFSRFIRSFRPLEASYKFMYIDSLIFLFFQNLSELILIIFFKDYLSSKLIPRVWLHFKLAPLSQVILSNLLSSTQTPTSFFSLMYRDPENIDETLSF